MDPKIWSDMLHPDISIIEKILRPVIVYIFLIIGLRLAGKRELAQLNPFDLVVLLTLSNTVQNAIIGNDNSVTGGLIGAVTLLTLNALVARFLFKHPQIDKMVEGTSNVLLENGQIKHDRLKKELITLTDLESAARKEGFASLDEVERAVLEPGGSISCIGKQSTLDKRRHNDLLARLDQINKELVELRAAGAR